MERVVNGHLDELSTKPFVKTADRKFRYEGKDSLIELESIKGDIVVSTNSRIDKGMSILTHLRVRGGRVEEAAINVAVKGELFPVTRINVTVDADRIINGSELVACEVPKNVLGNFLDKLVVKVEKRADEGGGRIVEISLKEIEVRYPGESRKYVMLSEHTLEKETINIGNVEVQLKKCLESLPDLEEWRRSSEFSGRAAR